MENKDFEIGVDVAFKSLIRDYDKMHNVITVDPEGRIVKSPLIEKEINDLKEQLKKAEEVIAYYANSKNWSGEYSSRWKDIILEEDAEEDTEKGLFTGEELYVGGKKAREYLKQKEQLNDDNRRSDQSISDEVSNTK